MRFSFFNKLFLQTKIFILFVMISFIANAQKYNFVNYSVDNGLIQSQANNLCRDKMGHLWVTTMGGVSCYDGHTFKNYTTSNGLLSNLAYAVVCDSQNNILICTDKGLSVFNGRSFNNYTFRYNNKDHRVNAVILQSNNDYMVLAGARLFQITERIVNPLVVNNDTTLQFTALAQEGNLIIAAAFKKGLYINDNNQWQQQAYPTTGKGVFFVKKIESAKNKICYFLTTDGIFEFQNRVLVRAVLPEDIHQMNDIGSIASDDKNNLWMGTFRGALVVKPNQEFHYYNSTSGCTDNRISSILSDDDGNIWLATDGQGVFRYAICPFTYFDETNGLPQPVVMSIVRGKNGEIYTGTYGGGLVKIIGDKIEKYALPNSSVASQQILTATLDAKGMLWVGTQDNKIWKFDGSHFLPVAHDNDMPPGSISELFFDDHQRLWMATQFGFGFIDKDKFKLIKSNEFTWNFVQAGADSVMITTMNHLMLYTADTCLIISQNEHVKKSDVTGAVKGFDGNFLLMTNGYGILLWNMALDSVMMNITTQDGLNSDFIYNIKQDKQHRFWIGTGAGINKIAYDKAFGKYQISSYGRAEGMFGQESNKSAVMQNEDDKIWFGTTKGLFIYNEADEQTVRYPSQIILQNVKLFSQAIPSGQYNDSLSNWYNIPINLKLPHTENHLTFTFTAINFNNPDKIRYQYMIEGLEKVWSEPSIENTVIYPSIPPGKYIFKVRVYNAATPELEYPFEIKAPFYSTIWFRLIIVASLILIGVGIQALRNFNKKNKEKELQKLREEEQNKVRQRTAEDFHDEVGNKLTRISLLADILKSKTDNESIISLTDKIKDNTNELYTGTKDIIWALNPENDNLTEMLLYLEAFGNNLIQDTNISFAASMNPAETNGIMLPMGYNRNITMIFKEAMNNALKHSGCTAMSLLSKLIAPTQFEIKFTDNGSGIESNTSKKGNGLQNMQQRTSRINGLLAVNSSPSGTVIILTLNLPQ